jgi:hypothetical protein
MKNLELARKELGLADTADQDLANHLIGDALENIVSAFDGFGREICIQRGADIHFQNADSARRRVLETFGFDFADSIGPNEWERAARVFQKRHLLAHKMGVIDEEYRQKSKDPEAIVGRKVQLSKNEVDSAIEIIEVLGRRLFEGVFSTRP